MYDLASACIVVLASTFFFFAVAHIVLLWRSRNDFLIAVRSPRLACVAGMFASLCYISLVSLSLSGDVRRSDIGGVLCLPGQIVVDVAILLTALRLLVMYFPAHRVAYGRFVNEKRLFRGLVFVYASMEVSCWIAVGAFGVAKVASVLLLIGKIADAFFVVVGGCLWWKLKDVHDLSEISRDIRLVVVVMVVGLFGDVFLRLILFRNSPWWRYVMLVPLTVYVTSTVWILNIRPTRRILGQAPECVVAKICKWTRSSYTVAITAECGTLYQRRPSMISIRMLAIMAFEPLRAAFGQFCHKSLCGESFQFLQDVEEFRSDPCLNGDGDEKVGTFRGFGSFQGIINDYIREGSHSELNIDSKTRHAILEMSAFEVYSSLGMRQRREIFQAAQTDILHMLQANLLQRFILSDQYKNAIISP